MKIHTLDPQLTGRIQFRFSESLRVPENSGCYALSNIHDDILYIGMSVNLRQRMEQHLGDPRMTGRTSLGLATWFYYGFWLPEEIAVVEEQFLFMFKANEGRLPPLNRKGP